MSNFREKWNLSHKQFLFCQAYLKNYNCEEAYREVYGPGQNGYNMMRSRNVLAYLRHRLDIIHEAEEINYQWLIKELKKQILSGDKDLVSNASRTLQMAIKARDEVAAKLQAIEQQSKPVESNNNINIKIEENTKEE